MAENHIIEAHFHGCYSTDTSRRVYQYSYGQVLKISGIMLPSPFEAHFSNGGATKTQIGTDNVVSIPDEYLTSGDPVYVYIYLHDGDTDGETVYKITIPVSKRPKPTDDVPTPQEQSVITQTIAQLQDAKAGAEEARDTANASAILATEKAEQAGDAEEGARGYAQDASESAETAADAAEQAEASAQEADASAKSAKESAESITEEYVGGLVEEYIEEHPIKVDEEDPTVPAWAKEPEKPTYTAQEVGALPADTHIPTDDSELTNGAGYLDGAGVKNLLATEPCIPVGVSRADDPSPSFSAGYVLSMRIEDEADYTVYGTEGLTITGAPESDLGDTHTVTLPDRAVVAQMIDDAIAGKLDKTQRYTDDYETGTASIDDVLFVSDEYGNNKEIKVHINAQHGAVLEERDYTIPTMDTVTTAIRDYITGLDADGEGY